MITIVANTLYNEHYETMPVNFKLTDNDKIKQVNYRWKPKEWQEFVLKYESEPLSIASGSDEQFILERYYGYSSYDAKTTYEYEVCHASWKHFKVLDFQIKVDFEQTYGAEFAVLNTLEPETVIMAHGSRVSIENKRKL
jgi:hypothetical protein